MLCSLSDAGKEGRKGDGIKISQKLHLFNVFRLRFQLKVNIGVTKTLSALEDVFINVLFIFLQSVGWLLLFCQLLSINDFSSERPWKEIVYRYFPLL